MIIQRITILKDSIRYLGLLGEYKKMNINSSNTKLLKISCMGLVLIIIAQVTIVDTANALTRYFNCTTRMANADSTFSIDGAEACYDRVFKGALDNDRYGNPLDKP
jgi:hypothetical protein